MDLKQINTRDRYNEVLREYIQDSPELNKLVDGYENQPADLDRALCKALDNFNTMPPPLGSYSFDSFPSPGLLLDGAAVEVLKSAIFRKIRNKLMYQDSGFAADEDANHGEYTAYMDYLNREWKERATNLKRSINISSCWGGSPSEYSLLFPYTARQAKV